MLSINFKIHINLKMNIKNFKLYTIKVLDFEYSLILGIFFYCIWLEVTQIYINFIYLNICLFIYSLKKGLYFVLDLFSSAFLKFEQFRAGVFFRAVFEKFLSKFLNSFRAVYKQFRAVLQNSSRALSSRNP